MEIHDWLDAGNNIRIGLATPDLVVFQSPVSASGRVEGLPTDTKSQYRIQAYIITNQEYPQGSGEIKEDGSWKIDAIYLGAVDHDLFFRIYRISADKKVDVIVKESSHIQIQKL
jgi:hypothetical protein